MQQTLQANYVYAARQAYSTDNFLLAAQDQLAYSASQLGSKLNNADYLQAEVDRLKNQTDTFDMVLIIDANSRALATAPSSTGSDRARSSVSQSALKTLRNMSAYRHDQRPRMWAAPATCWCIIAAPIVEFRPATTLGHMSLARSTCSKRNMLATLLGSGYRERWFLPVRGGPSGQADLPPRRLADWRTGARPTRQCAPWSAVNGRQPAADQPQGRRHAGRLLAAQKPPAGASSRRPPRPFRWPCSQRPDAADPDSTPSPCYLLTLLAVWWLSRSDRPARCGTWPTYRQALAVRLTCPGFICGEVRARYFEAEQLRAIDHQKGMMHDPAATWQTQPGKPHRPPHRPGQPPRPAPDPGAVASSATPIQRDHPGHRPFQAGQRSIRP